MNNFDHFVNSIQYVFNAKNSIYDFEFETLDNQIHSLKEYEDKLLLIVNTASLCKLNSQYESLEKLYQMYKDDLVIVAFACNQFGELEPKSNEELKAFYNDKALHYIFAQKVDVNGSKAHPIFRYLKNQTSCFMQGGTIEWNFTKFLIAPHEKAIYRYSSMTQPLSLEYDIKKYL